LSSSYYAGVLSVTLQFDKTKVPAAETTYMCQMFELPSDGDYHVIATEPVIDNANVMHHVIVRMCTEEQGEWQS
jgi:dopamine beta-monooxygenase